MKKHLLSLLTGLLFATTIAAQTYEPVPFPMDSTIWTEIVGNGRQTNFRIVNKKFTFNNLEYNELRVTKECNYEKESIIGWLREDNNKIYYLPRTGDKAYKEKLLYDFNLKVGDKVKADYKKYYDPYIFVILETEKTITKIDTIYIGEKLRKRFYFNGGVKWIEGIGSLFGLISRFPLEDSNQTWINSVSQNNNIIYRHPVFSDCQINEYINTWHRLPTSNAAWSTEHRSNTEKENNFTHHYTESETFEYNRKIYNKLNEVYECDFENGKKWIGGIRESQGKFYFLLTDNTSSIDNKRFNTLNKEYLLYDFTLKKNDYIQIDSDIEGGTKVQIIEIDSVRIGDTKRKQLHLNTPGHDIWIEGIGSIRGLFNNYTFTPENEQTDRLNYMGMPNQTLFSSQDVNAADCFLNYSTDYYHPLLKDNKVWNEHDSPLYYPEGCIASYKCSPEDTVIIEKTYKKIHIQEYDGDKYIGAMRETDRKVYMIKDGTEEEYLLYDFTLQIGDTLKTIACDEMWDNCYPLEAKLENISTEIVNGISRKVYRFDNIFIPYIEGIGSLTSFVNPSKPIPLCNFFHLGSVIENGDIIYGNCFYTATRLQRQPKALQYTIRSVYPELIVEFPANTFKQANVTNMSGQIVDSERTYNNEQVNIPTDKYQPGIYLLHLQGNEYREVVKIVINHQ